MFYSNKSKRTTTIDFLRVFRVKILFIFKNLVLKISMHKYETEKKIISIFLIYVILFVYVQRVFC